MSGIFVDMKSIADYIVPRRESLIFILLCFLFSSSLNGCRFDSIRAVKLRTRKYEIIITTHETQFLFVIQIVVDPHPTNID